MIRTKTRKKVPLMLLACFVVALGLGMGLDRVYIGIQSFEDRGLYCKDAWLLTIGGRPNDPDCGIDWKRYGVPFVHKEIALDDMDQGRVYDAMTRYTGFWGGKVESTDNVILQFVAMALSRNFLLVFIVLLGGLLSVEWWHRRSSSTQRKS